MTQTTKINKNTVIVGIDPHKYTHSAVFLDFLGRELDYLEFSTTQIDKLEDKINSAILSKKQVIVALEDTEFFGAHIVKKLLKLHNVSLRHVPPHLSARIRGRKHKNDKEDAISVAKSLLFDFDSSLPLKNKYTKDKEKLKALKLALREREELIKQSVRTSNRLHTIIHLSFGDNEKISSLEKNLQSKKAQEELKTILSQVKNNSYGASIALLKLKELLVLKDNLQALDKQITELAEGIDEVQRLKKSIYGCGTITASIIVAETQDISRFKSESHFASYAVVSPKEKSSASKTKMLTNKMGNKRLNKALHFIALAQITKGNTKGHKYYKKKLESGKAKLSALRSLKRYIARKVYRTLKNS